MSKTIGDVILDVKNISLRFGGVKALTDISFNVREHEVRAIIGPNGAGKSSMLNCINGVYTPSEGSITFRGQTFDHMDSHQVARMGIARTFQNLALFKGMSVLDNILPSERRLSTAKKSNASSTFWKFKPFEKPPWVNFPTVCKNVSTWVARWRWSHKSCCLTSPWPA